MIITLLNFISEGIYGNNNVDGNGGVDGVRCETENSTEEDEFFNKLFRDICSGLP